MIAEIKKRLAAAAALQVQIWHLQGEIERLVGRELGLSDYIADLASAAPLDEETITAGAWLRDEVVSELLAEWQDDKAQFTKLHKAGKDIEAIYDFQVNWEWLHENVSEKIEIADDSPQTMRTSLNHAGWTDADIWKSHLDICDEQIHVQTHRLEALSKEKE